ncbi:hypothetical protein [Phenylobacterium sp.]|uniref:hypothetical protein n=1 Tax=Phenylobacterium sp. TaxID=1871053 RepID=UPI0025D632A9|nr:hypothetical protein [Phenylobacterium sp.]MBX3484128.1 hypothetical protein [Phenylobacterium sp.]MCW5760572.1 hypothetical protein [Phenylobacterium sp.]
MKYAFASPGWMAFMHGLIVERVQRLKVEAPGVGWSMCEVFTDPPRDLSPDGSPLCWHVVVKDGEVRFGAYEIDDVEFKVIVDYAACVPLGRYDTRGDPARRAELTGMSAVLREAGKMRIVGDRSNRDPRIGDFHDIIARVTA